MIFYIPACGDRLVLDQDWSFDLYLEHRNMDFAKAQGLVDLDSPRWGGCYEPSPDGRYSGRLKKVKAKVEAGYTLEVARVYIRQFSKSAIKVDEDYDSITFRVLKGDKPVKKARFWVKLPDTYEIEYHQDPDSRYRDRVKAVKEVMER